MRGCEAHHLLILALALGGLTAGCGPDQVTGSGSKSPTWDMVQFHNVAAGDQDLTKDLTVRSDGDLNLSEGRGNAVSTRGLLAGEKLETLARYVAALPPHSYASSTPCPSDSFVVSVARGSEVLTYVTGSCDPAPPAALTGMRSEFDQLVGELGEARLRVVSYTVLAQGVHSAIHDQRELIVRDRDALLRLLAEHSPGAPVAIPRIDFASQMVIAAFLGDQPSNGYAVSVDGVEQTDSNWLRLDFRQVDPGPSCVISASVTQPFVLVAVPAESGSVLYATTTVETQCH